MAGSYKQLVLGRYPMARARRGALRKDGTFMWVVSATREIDAPILAAVDKDNNKSNVYSSAAAWQRAWERIVKRDKEADRNANKEDDLARPKRATVRVNNGDKGGKAQGC